MEPSVWEKMLPDITGSIFSVFRLDEEYNEHWDYFLGQLLKYIVVRLHTALAEY